MTLQWLEIDRERGRSEINHGSDDKVKLERSELHLDIICAYHHNLHHFHIQIHFNTLLFNLLPNFSLFPPCTVSPLLIWLFIFYHLFYIYFIPHCVHCPSLWSCHGKTECTKWWFIPVFPGPLQIVACLCFCFFFPSPFSDTIFPAWHRGMCVVLLLVYLFL